MFFSENEYKHRKSRATKLMKEHGFDAMMVTGDFSAADNYRYLSGHLPRDFQQNFARPHIMILTADGRAGLVVLETTAAAAKEMSWVTDIRDYLQPFTIEPLEELIKDLELQSAKIGCELGADQRLHMPIQEFMKLYKKFPEANFADCTELIWDLRMIKSDEEVKAIQKAAQINYNALTTALSNLKEGMSEHDAINAIMIEHVKEGANRPPFSQFLSTSSATYRTGGSHASRFSGPSKEPLIKGDLLFVDTGCVFEGYWGEFSRMAVIGEPSQDQKDKHRRAREITQRTISEAIKPGVTSEEIMNYTIKLYKEYGVDESKYLPFIQHPFNHIGHSIGLTSSEPPLIQLHNDSVIKEGMVLAIEPRINEDDFTYHSEENIRVTKNGVEYLTDVDKGLFVGKTN